VQRSRQFIEAKLCGAGGEDGGQQRGFGWIAKERNLRGAQCWSKSARDLSEGQRGLDQQRRGDRALAQRNHSVRAAAAIAHVPRRIEGQTDSVAIAPGLGLGLASQHGNLRGHGHAAAFQGFAQDNLLEGQLGCVVRVLVVAAAADAEVRAGGRDALRRGADDLLDFGSRVAGLARCDAHARLFARQRERHKNGLAFKARQECAAVDRLPDFDELRIGGRRGF